MCVHKSPPETKRLAYLILAQLQEPEESQNALMPINLLHKETQVREPLRRADALKTLVEMSVDEVHPWLYTVVKQLCYDVNPYVRKTALICLLKLQDLTEFNATEYHAEVLELIEHGMKDPAIEIRSLALVCGSVLI